MIDIYLKDDQNDLKYIYEKYSEYETVNLEYESTSIMAIFKMLSMNSLLSTKKLFVIIGAKFLTNKTDKLKKKEEEVWDDLLKLDNENKLIFLIDKPLNKTIPSIKENMDSINYIENITEQKDEDFLKKYSINISRANFKYIKDNIEDGWDYQQELIKLNLYKEKQEISKEDIEKFIKLKNNVNIFNFIEYVLLDKKEESLHYYNKILIEEDMQPVQILAVMYTQIKFYITLKVLQDKGFSQPQIVKKLKTSPYRVKNSISIVNKLELKKLVKISNMIAKYDYLVKSGKTKEENIIINFLI